MFPFDDVIMFQEDKLEVMNGLGITNYEQIMNVISCWSGIHKYDWNSDMPN